MATTTPTPTAASPKPGIELVMTRLDVGMRQLKVQYDMFFAGSLKREPVELRNELQKMIKYWSNGNIAAYADRFRFNTLVSRFNSLIELWNRSLRRHEASDRRSEGIAERFGIREQLVARAKIDPGAEGSDPEGLRRIHSHYCRARRRAGEKTPSFGAFVKGLDAQITRLRNKTGCDSVEVRLVQTNDEVRLKARPGK